MNITRKEINVETGEEIETILTPEELQAMNVQEAAYVAEMASATAELQAEKERIAGAIGLTLDELKLLLS